ncbi:MULTISPECIES: chemotaxis protein CheB [Roseomonadaceae]|uniref:Chemotaxis protein CheB n=1 Tax=Falsiroseomonas oleicola TaxID=2801474 RepID=A0ABS6H4Q7_9PROT|nr:chemotaxis protein CheB [Roseomonas oleicola]MBU8543449.1 chemotaxis protein CheB [Roseomonas oleicola]
MVALRFRQPPRRIRGSGRGMPSPGASHVNHSIIVLGASAGGVEVLSTVCRGLADDLPAAVFVVQHVSPGGLSRLPEILSRAGPLKAHHAVEGERVELGRIYVALPDRHLLLDDGGDRVLLRRGPQENRARPAVDALFRSAAVACGSRVIGVVLSGMLDDGAEGLDAIRRCGGVTVVQDPADAEWPDMPCNARERAGAEHCLPAADLPALLLRLARSAAGPAVPIPAELVLEARISRQELTVMSEDITTVGKPSALGCPECGGVLNVVGEATAPRFRCQVGHAYGPKTLAAHQAESLDKALGVAYRTQRDRRNLYLSMERAARQRNRMQEAARWQKSADEAQRFADLIGTAVDELRQSGMPPTEGADA